MKKYIRVVSVVILFFSEQVMIYSQNASQNFHTTHAQIMHKDIVDEFEKDDEKLLKEMLEIISFSYKNIIDIAALYFCGLSVDKNKLYEQVIIQLSKDIFSVIKLFAWYVPAMLKNPKVKTKEKLKKSSFVICATIVCWYLCAEILQKKTNNSLGIIRYSDVKQYDKFSVYNDVVDTSEALLKPRNRPK